MANNDLLAFHHHSQPVSLRFNHKLEDSLDLCLVDLRHRITPPNPLLGSRLNRVCRDPHNPPSTPLGILHSSLSKAIPHNRHLASNPNKTTRAVCIIQTTDLRPPLRKSSTQTICLAESK
uniref:Uncharacterized protein n=1 Tax=Cacopsylla melanoneura TaxID=428564 RepID=A0A8D9END3_9HEMI